MVMANICDFIAQTFYTLSESIDYVFLGFCSCVFHCFRFVEPIILSVDYVLYFIRSVLMYNNMVIEYMFTLIGEHYTWLRELYRKVSIVCCGFFNGLSQTPTYVTNKITKVSQKGFCNCCYLIQLLTNFMYESFSKAFETGIMLGECIRSLPMQLIYWLYITAESLLEVTKIALMNGLTITFDSIGFLALHIVNSVDYICTHIIECMPSITSIAFLGENFANFVVEIFKFCCKIVFDILSYIGAILWKLLCCPNQIKKFVVEYLLYGVWNSLTSVFAAGHSIVLQLEIKGFLVGLIIILVTVGPCLIYNIELKHLVSMIFQTFHSYILHFFGDRVQQNRNQATEEPTEERRSKMRHETEPNAQNAMTCAVCQEGTKSILLLPCKHLCLCSVCIDVILDMPIRHHKCPLCRRRIQDYMNVYL